MKKLILCCLAIVLVPIGVANGQGKPSAFNEYAKLREAFRQHNGDESRIQYALAAVTQRLDTRSAQIEFAVAGKMAGYILEIQPVNLAGDEAQPVASGELSKVRESVPAGLTADYVSEPTTIVPVNGAANALQITWKPDGATYSGGAVFIVALSDKPTAAAFGITLPAGLTGSINQRKVRNVTFSTTASKKRVTCNCYQVSLFNDTCGYICKWCANTVGNVIDGVRCSIRCGTPCGDVCPKCD